MAAANPSMYKGSIEDFFKLLNIKPDFDLDEKKLEAAYIAAQRESHPDLLAKATPEQRHKAVQQSASVNQAYKTLKSPLKRAEYLLNLRGVHVNEEEKGLKPSQAVLLQSLEMREALMEAGSPEQVAKLKIQAEEEKDRQWDIFRKHYAAENWEAAGQAVIHLTFLTKFLEEIRLRSK
ncbi:MAG: Fe-S protein assembly co-chaperone HscB [Rickettsiales bacterium]